MKISRFLLAALLALWLVGSIVPSVLAQDEVVPVEAVDETEPAERSQTDRLLDLEQILEENRQKLADLDQDYEEWTGFINMLGDQIHVVNGQLDESRVQLDELAQSEDTEERALLEGWIAKQEELLVILKAQGDLSLMTELTIGEQRLTLAEYIELEERARAQLRGAKISTPGQAEATVSPVTPPAPGGGSVLPSLIPGLPAAPVTSAPARIASRLETPEQIRALRELERLEYKLAEDEQRVVEFVELRESLEKMILLEDRLLQTARQSKENLGVALGWYAEVREQEDSIEARLWPEGDLDRSEERINRLIGMTDEKIAEHLESLKVFRKRYEGADPEELLITGKVDVAREAVDEAQDKLYWLQSPLHPRNLLQWARTRGPRILLVLVVAGALLLMLRLTVRRTARLLVPGRRGERGRGSNRADTLAFSFRSAATVVIMVGSVLLVFQEAGLDIKTVLGGAAILGVAIAFGAQNLMRDYFTGFLILLEDQYELGDLITIGSITGTVESVNMRVTVLRDLEGRVHFVPNGEIKAVTNRTYGWGRAVLEVPIGYKENVDRAMEVLQGVSKELKADPVFGEWIEEDPVMLGVDKFTEYGVVIKFMLKTQPDKMFAVRRELLRRVKNKFDEVGIEISVPHRVVVQQKSDV